MQAPPACPCPAWQGNTLSLTVRRGGTTDGGAAVALEGVGSTARVLVPDVPVCEASVAYMLHTLRMLRAVATAGWRQAPTGWLACLIQGLVQVVDSILLPVHAQSSAGPGAPSPVPPPPAAVSG